MSSTFSFDELKQMKRSKLGNQVPLELFRTIRLIGMHEALPLGGKGTTLTIGRKIGEQLPVETIDELLALLEELKIGIPHVTHRHEHGMTIAVDDCFCEGIPEKQGMLVCDLEGAILEGALTRIWGKRVNVKEVRCNVNGDERCEYEIRL